MQKEFPIEVVVGLASGINLGKFGDIHECAEFIAGHSIWTHEFADKALWKRLRDLVHQQHPQLADVEISTMKPEEVPAVVEQLHERFSKTLTLTKGSGERTENPIESLERMYPGKPVVVVET